MILYFFPLLVFAVALRVPKFLVPVLVVILPSYLLRTTIVGVPTTALELSIFAAVAGTVIMLLSRRIVWNFSSPTRWVWIMLSTWTLAWILATVFSLDRVASLGAFKAWYVDPLLVLLLASLLVTTSTDRLRVLQSIIFSGCSDRKSVV